MNSLSQAAILIYHPGQGLSVRRVGTASWVAGDSALNSHPSVCFPDPLLVPTVCNKLDSPKADSVTEFSM